MIRAASLTIGYGNREIVRDISFNLASEESLLILGHNGAGKTTLLRTLFGLLPLLHGDVEVLGLKAEELTPARLMKKGARFLGQGNRGFSHLKVAESRRVLRKLYGFEPQRQSFGNDFAAKRIGRLSSGQRRLEALELLAAGSAQVYFLDEPTAGLDPVARERIVRWITEMRSQGRGFVIVEQAFEEFFEHLDRVLVIRGGKMTFFGEPQELGSTERLLETYL